MIINSAIQSSWLDWLDVTRDRCHLNFELEGGSIASHIKAAINSGKLTAKRVKSDIGSLQVKRVLEVGCSVGFNCIGLSVVFPCSEIYGIEPDFEAVDVGSTMLKEYGLTSIQLMKGSGECLPFDDGFFDLIVCHTVIEHVDNVELVLSEMTRVLSSQGVLHLEAPNYIWPYEPHLGIWCVPLFGKTLTRLFALVQGKQRHLSYLNHLKFVHPCLLEDFFRRNKLFWENRVERKLDLVLSGNLDSVKAYRLISRILRLMGKSGISYFLKKAILASMLYPSVLYSVRK